MTDTFYLTYDAENRMIEVGGDADASFTYDGDGTRVVGMISATGTITTVYIGEYYEYVITGTEVITRQYYYAGTQRVAMREEGELYFLLTDQRVH